MKTRNEAGNWKKDRELYGRGAWLVQPSYWAVAVYRFGRWTKTAPRIVRLPTHGLYFLLYAVVRLATGIDLPRGAEIGPGLLIHHFGGVIVNPRSKIGSMCVMRQGVTIGTQHDMGAAPVLGDGVNLGAYAQVIGGVLIGDGATVGALTLVLRDVPSNSTVVGIPARILKRDNESEISL